VICSRSEYFRALCLGGMRESTQQQIEIHDTSSFGFNKLIKYLYTQQLPIDKKIKKVDEKFVEMLIVSDKFGCDELKEQLENWIGQHLTIENVSSLFVVSERYNALKLKKQCHKFIQQNYEKVKQTPEYQGIAEEVEKLMKEMKTTQSNNTNTLKK
jgi:hypothetical protein